MFVRAQCLMLCLLGPPDHERSALATTPPKRMQSSQQEILAASSQDKQGHQAQLYAPTFESKRCYVATYKVIHQLS